MKALPALFRATLAAAFLTVAGYGQTTFGPADFQLLAVHPDALLQPQSSVGRTISNITPFDGKLYFGYGDYSANTGPMVIRALAADTATWSDPLLSFGSESISLYRNLGGKLYTPNIDPLGLPGDNQGGYALGIPAGGGVAWSQEDRIEATHVFDINSLDGSDLWMVGSLLQNAGVWRSTDGGQSFTTVRLDAPTNGGISRYFGAAVYQNQLYIQPRDGNSVVDASLVFDGTDWTTGPDMVPDDGSANRYPWRPEVFIDELVYFDRFASSANLYRFDGTQAELAHSEGMYDFFVTADTLFGLTTSSKVIGTSDLVNWTEYGTAPETARSLGMVEETLYVGTTDSEIYMITVPEPAMPWLAGSLLLIFAVRYVRTPVR